MSNVHFLESLLQHYPFNKRVMLSKDLGIKISSVKTQKKNDILFQRGRELINLDI